MKTVVMMRTSSLIAKNASANLIRGGATAIVALALPHFLARSFDHERFAAWSLLLQMSAYAGYLDFGIQTAVARFLAGYMERGDERHRDGLVSTALVFLSAAGVLVLAVTILAVWQVPRLFQGVPVPLLPEFRVAMGILGSSAALALPLSAFSGVLLGLHRNEYVAAAVGGSRLLGALEVLTLARHTRSLILMSACIATSAVLGALAQAVIAKRLLPALSASLSGVCAATALELGKYCTGLTIWSVGMLLVSGLDVAIVGHVDFSAVGYYSIAAILVTLFSGAHTAACSAFMTPVAALHASGQVDRIRKVILSATRLSTFVNLLAITGTFLGAKYLLRAWVGEPYAGQALPIVKILILAHGVRLVMNPYASALIATDLQRHGIAQGLIEGIINLGCSLLGAYWIGPVGVALGTLVGAICGLAWTCLLTVRRTAEISLGRRKFISEGLLYPFLCSLPLLICAIIMRDSTPGVTTAALIILSGLSSYLLMWRFGGGLPKGLRLSNPFAQAR